MKKNWISLTSRNKEEGLNHHQTFISFSKIIGNHYFQKFQHFGHVYCLFEEVRRRFFNRWYSFAVITPLYLAEINKNMLIKVGPPEFKTAFYSFISEDKLAPRSSSSEPHKQVCVGLTNWVHSNKNVCKVWI